jgi:hypothetical protein
MIPLDLGCLKVDRVNMLESDSSPPKGSNTYIRNSGAGGGMGKQH